MTQKNYIETVEAFRTLDGERFLDINEARDHVTKKRMIALRDAATKDMPELINVSFDHFVSLMNRCAHAAVRIMDDPLIPNNPVAQPRPAAPMPQPGRPADIPATNPLREAMARVDALSAPPEPLEEDLSSEVERVLRSVRA